LPVCDHFYRVEESGSRKQPNYEKQDDQNYSNVPVKAQDLCKPAILSVAVHGN